MNEPQQLYDAQKFRSQPVPANVHYRSFAPQPDDGITVREREEQAQSEKVDGNPVIVEHPSEMEIGHRQAIHVNDIDFEVIRSLESQPNEERAESKLTIQEVRTKFYSNRIGYEAHEIYEIESKFGKGQAEVPKRRNGLFFSNLLSFFFQASLSMAGVVNVFWNMEEDCLLPKFALVILLSSLILTSFGASVYFLLETLQEDTLFEEVLVYLQDPTAAPPPNQHEQQIQSLPLLYQGEDKREKPKSRCPRCLFDSSDTRRYHCTTCNKCVSEFDHHSSWLNTCICRKNYTSYFYFIKCTAVYLAAVIALHFVGLPKVPEEILEFVIYGSLLLHILAFFFVLKELSIQLNNLCLNMTSLERNPPKEPIPQPEQNPHDAPQTERHLMNHATAPEEQSTQGSSSQASLQTKRIQLPLREMAESYWHNLMFPFLPSLEVAKFEGKYKSMLELHQRLKALFD